MSMMRVIILHQYTNLKLEGLSVWKIWLIFGHSVNGPGDLDL